MLLIFLLIPSTLAALDTKQLPIVSKEYHTPDLKDVASVLSTGLKKFYAHATVEVVECPDLSKEPFSLSGKGLNGKPRLVELGAVSNLVPVVNKTKVYDLKEVTKVVGVNPAFVIGAGTGPFDEHGESSEAMYDLFFDNNEITQRTTIGKINFTDDSSYTQRLNGSVIDGTLLLNLFYSQGKPGEVLKVHVKQRTGNTNFPESIRLALLEHYGKEKPIGLGGVFLVKEGQVQTHLLPNFPDKPIKNEEEMQKWLKFYNVSAPAVAVGTLTTSDFDLDLRAKHFHVTTNHDEAGHYHSDVTPDIIEYEGYFNVGESVYRIDKPTQYTAFGKL